MSLPLYVCFPQRYRFGSVSRRGNRVGAYYYVSERTNSQVLLSRRSDSSFNDQVLIISKRFYQVGSLRLIVLQKGLSFLLIMRKDFKLHQMQRPESLPSTTL